MARMKITRWGPDTCECILDYEWDADLPLESRTFTIVGVFKTCDAHSGLATIQQKFNQVKDENGRKNKVYGLIEQYLPSAFETVVNPDGTTYTVLAGGREFSWSFDVNRNILINLVNFTAQEKTTITNYAALLPEGSKIIIV